MMVAIKHEWPAVERQDIPAFANEEEEHQFWATHSLGPRMLTEMESVPPEGDEWAPPVHARAARPVALRLGDDVVTGAKALD